MRNKQEIITVSKSSASSAPLLPRRVSRKTDCDTKVNFNLWFIALWFKPGLSSGSQITTGQLKFKPNSFLVYGLNHYLASLHSMTGLRDTVLLVSWFITGWVGVLVGVTSNRLCSGIGRWISLLTSSHVNRHILRQYIGYRHIDI